MSRELFHVEFAVCGFKALGIQVVYMHATYVCIMSAEARVLRVGNVGLYVRVYAFAVFVPCVPYMVRTRCHV